MPYREVLVPWDSQPQEAVDIDWSNPLLYGAEFIRLGSSIFFNPTARVLNRVNSNGIAATKRGLGQICGSSQYETYPAQSSNGGVGPWTLAGLFMPVANISANSSLVGMVDAPGSNANDKSIRFSPSNSSWEAYLWDGVAKVANSGILPKPGRTDSVIATTNTSALVINVNGVDSSTAVTSGGYSGYATANICVGFASPTPTRPFALPLLVRTNRYWDANLRKSFVDNPWQIFAPRTQRIWVPAGVGGLPTLSAATFVPGSLTSTGFRPRVTATY